MISQSFFNGFSRFWCLNYSTLNAEHDGTKINVVLGLKRGQYWLVLGRALNKLAARPPGKVVFSGRQMSRRTLGPVYVRRFAKMPTSRQVVQMLMEFFAEFGLPGVIRIRWRATIRVGGFSRILSHKPNRPPPVLSSLPAVQWPG